MSTSRLPEILLEGNLSTPLERKLSDSLLQVSPSPSLVKFSSVHDCPSWLSSTPLPVPTASSVSQGGNKQELKEILDFQKSLEVLENNEESEVDSGFESLIQSVDESYVSVSRTEDRGEGGKLTEPSRSLGAIPKRPSIKQMPVTDRLVRFRNGSRTARRHEDPSSEMTSEISRSKVTSVVRPFRPDRTGREVCDVLRCLWQMNLSSDVLETLFGFLSPADLCSVAQVSLAWRQALQATHSHNERRLTFISRMKIERENMGVELNLQPQRILPRRVMQEMGQARNRTSSNSAKRDRNRSVSTACSPSKVRHQMFVKEASKLRAGEKLVPCSECQSPSRVTAVQPWGQKAQCTSTLCLRVFCPECKARAFRYFT